MTFLSPASIFDIVQFLPELAKARESSSAHRSAIFTCSTKGDLGLEDWEKLKIGILQGNWADLVLFGWES